MECVKTKPVYPIVSCRGRVLPARIHKANCFRASEPRLYVLNDSIFPRFDTDNLPFKKVLAFSKELLHLPDDSG